MTQQIKLTGEKLCQKVWAQATVKVAAEFGISDVGLAKICCKTDVPKPAQKSDKHSFNNFYINLIIGR